MDWGVSREELKSRVERILSDILSDKHDVNIKVKFRDKQESEDETRRSYQDTSRYRTDARKRARRVKREDASN